jgi:hypothetical protein
MANRVATATARPGTGRSGGTHGCVPKPKCTASTFALLCERRTVNPPIARTRYNFLRSFFRAGLPRAHAPLLRLDAEQPPQAFSKPAFPRTGVDHDGLIHQVLELAFTRAAASLGDAGGMAGPKTTA